MLSAYLAEFATVVVVHLLAVMSPGPDFVMISRNSLVHSRRAGIYAAFGLGLGILGHVTYSLIGIGFVIANSIVLYSVLKCLGAGYLVYLGYRALRAAPASAPAAAPAAPVRADLPALAAVRMGFLTNILNPKATLFFFALFTQVIDPHTPKAVQVLYGLEMAFATFAWFALVAVVLSHARVRGALASILRHVERAFGAILIALGLKVALSAR